MGKYEIDIPGNVKNRKAYLRKKADKLWMEAVFSEYGRSCEICGKQANQVHHFFPKGRSTALRYETDNGIPICQGCHMKHHTSADPTIHRQIVRNRGEEWYNRLEKKMIENRGKISTTMSWYDDKIKELKAR